MLAWIRRGYADHVAPGLRRLHLPPVPGVWAAVLAGLIVPFLLEVDAVPTELRPSLARRRLRAFRPEPVPVGPRGEILHDRPAFAWREVPDAHGYFFKLLTAEGSVYNTTEFVSGRRHLLEPPDRLQRGRRYTWWVQALDRDRRRLGEPVQVPFSVAKLEARTAGPGRSAARLTDPARRALALAGWYATLDSPHDVASALEIYLRHAPDGEDADLARRTLQALGRR
ncbi:MAG: hypothetical protein ACE5JG_04110 [Planctomycetota bacterium]